MRHACALPPWPRPELCPVAGVRFRLGGRAWSQPLRPHPVAWFDEGTAVGGVFPKPFCCRTRCRYVASISPVATPFALVVNTGIANAATGDQGPAGGRGLAARLVWRRRSAIAAESGVAVLHRRHPRHLPVDRIAAGHQPAPAEIKAGKLAAWDRRANHHDHRRHKPASQAGCRRRQDGPPSQDRQRGRARLSPTWPPWLGVSPPTGIASRRRPGQGAAVMRLFKAASSVDGDASTNDSFVLIASGGSGGQNRGTETGPRMAPPSSP